MKLKGKNKEKTGGAKVVKHAAPEGSLRHVDLDVIVDSDELEYRTLKPDHVSNLKSSIRRSGLDTPLAVWDGGEEGLELEIEGRKGAVPATYLLAGQHRREALNDLAREESGWFKKTFPEGIPVKVYSGKLEDAIAAQARENAMRDNPEPYEFLPQLKRLQDEFKKKPSEIAKMIGKSKSWVSQVLDIEKQLGPKALKKVIAGELGFTDAIEAAKEVKQEKKAGKDPDVKGKIAKAAKKAKSKKASGKKRAERTMGAKAVAKAYLALPDMSNKKKVEIADAAFAYIVDPEENELPEDLTADEEEE